MAFVHDANLLAELKIIISDTVLDEAKIKPYEETAYIMIETYMDSLGEELKSKIKLFLTAHFLSIAEKRRAAQEEYGDASITYEGHTGMGLDATLYGQTAKMLDSSLKLNKVSENSIKGLFETI